MLPGHFPRLAGPGVRISSLALSQGAGIRSCPAGRAPQDEIVREASPLPSCPWPLASCNPGRFLQALPHVMEVAGVEVGANPQVRATGPTESFASANEWPESSGSCSFLLGPDPLSTSGCALARPALPSQSTCHPSGRISPDRSFHQEQNSQSLAPPDCRADTQLRKNGGV